ncbi:mucosa-associated lymphoid tissue lymphoma translocation protein 1-like isoform X2 [Nylanderia fulva]|uniref:mucosa-associated lymphoid tissue lymphoma translocation protein 1-like isoform X2 n=1 Tax=Nylanderia fulva TaxID=613905 RepID=UPI0010FAD7D9|nr:mucosa-associated lymphoid tissue lymphoma translocation protein 1-like isoform X2 [Nylanderia fulva]
MAYTHLSKFDEDRLLYDLPISIYKKLVNKLNENFNYRKLQAQIKKTLPLVTTKFNNHMGAENIFDELRTKMCSVGTLEPIIIVKHPSDDMVCNTLQLAIGEKLHLSCKAVGTLLSYQWYHNNIKLRGQKKRKLDITINSCEDAGEYNCKISQVIEGEDEDEEALNSVLRTESVFVTIPYIPVCMQQQPPILLEIEENEDLIIKCKARSHPKPCYQWFKDNTMLEGKTSNVLHIKQSNFNVGGQYYCHISNSMSEVITKKTLVLVHSPREKAIAKIALIIANDEYENLQCLMKPRYDAMRIHNRLKKIDFKVICFLNLSLEQMRNAIKIFSEVLTKGVYGLFYYCGHGFKMQESHMLAVDTPESFLRKDSICESELLAMLQQKDPTLLVTILDMCQTVPQRECNPDIYNEIPEILETNINYKSRKNLRNLVQAYSTSSYCPSYERESSQSGLYAMHLSNYITQNIPIIKVFEEVGKSIDKVLKGTERNQIPMYSTNTTKHFRLTDAIQSERNPSPMLNNLNELMAFSKKSFEIRLSEIDITAKITVSLMNSYLNVLKVSVHYSGDLKLSFFTSATIKSNNLSCNEHGKCYIFNPQICQGPLIISISKNGITYLHKLHIQQYIPPILKRLQN